MVKKVRVDARVSELQKEIEEYHDPVPEPEDDWELEFWDDYEEEFDALMEALAADVMLDDADYDGNSETDEELYDVESDY